jgi:hypothetical protein
MIAQNILVNPPVSIFDFHEGIQRSFVQGGLKGIALWFEFLRYIFEVIIKMSGHFVS